MSESLTVVAPAWNEGPNLRAFWQELAPHLPAGSRLLVVCDRDDDDTLPVARALAAEGAPIETLRNRGRGFPGALLTGLSAVEAGPILVTMADRSDDPAAVPAMLAAYRGGAELVVGSRFMPGGRLQGAPVLKGMLARWGGLALFHGAGLPVHDASNAYRIYDAALVRRLPPVPAVGFEVVMALLLAAWRQGARIAEVPVGWKGRERGASRFRLAWVPRYARLWLSALTTGAARRRRRKV